MVFLKKFILKIIFNIGYYFGLFKLCDYLNTKSARVFTYHGIVKNKDVKLSGMDISEKIFAEQIKLLHKRYKIVPLSNVGKKPGTIAITFDDGSLSQFSKALPILEAYKIKATFFVCSDLIIGKRIATWCDLSLINGLYSALNSGLNKKEAKKFATSFALKFEGLVRKEVNSSPDALLNPFCNGGAVTNSIIDFMQSWDAERFSPIREKEIIKLVTLGHEIGSHGLSHLVLSNLNLNPVILYQELKESKETIEKIINRKLKYISYPFGRPEDVGVKVEMVASRVGYESGYYNYWTGSADLFKRGRISMPSTSNSIELFAITSGFYHFIKTGKLL